MIIVLGSVTLTPEHQAEGLTLACGHSRRSREEPGCISHDVSIDPDNPTQLTFVERWLSVDALQVHFQVPESAEFVAAIRKLASESPRIEIWAADAIDYK